MLEVDSRYVGLKHFTWKLITFLKIKLWFDAVALQLVVTLVCAAGLTPRSNGEPRNPYVKLYLLPDHSEKSKRRSKTIGSTNDPRYDPNLNLAPNVVFYQVVAKFCVSGGAARGFEGPRPRTYRMGLCSYRNQRLSGGVVPRTQIRPP